MSAASSPQLPDLEFARLVAMWYGAHGGSSLRPSSPAISPEISSTNASYPSVPAVSPSAEPGPSMSTAAIQTMLPQFGQIERRAVGPHGASRIKMEGSEKASLRNMRFLLAQHPVGVRVLQAAREAAVETPEPPTPTLMLTRTLTPTLALALALAVTRPPSTSSSAMPPSRPR